jgi:hypothetical protein
LRFALVTEGQRGKGATKVTAIVKWAAAAGIVMPVNLDKPVKRGVAAGIAETNVCAVERGAAGGMAKTVLCAVERAHVYQGAKL